jgi:LysM repeat protein
MRATRIIKVLAGQSLINIACQYSGNAEAMPEIARINNLEYTQDLIPGMELKIPDTSTYENKSIAKYFENKAIYPATEMLDKDICNINDPGIGQMIIKQTFIVR